MNVAVSHHVNDQLIDADMRASGMKLTVPLVAIRINQSLVTIRINHSKERLNKRLSSCCK